MVFYASLLRDIAEQCGLTPIRQIARQPGIQGVYRVTVRYADGPRRHSTATLRRAVAGPAVLEVIHQGRFKNKPLVYSIDEARYQSFVRALQKTGFDRLPDQPDAPYFGADLWLVERAAGNFVKSVIIAPSKVRPPYTAVVNAIDGYLPEALREVR